MVETKSLEATRANWTAAQGRVPAAYQAGVQAASNVIAKSVAAEDNYAAGVTGAVAARSRAKGLESVTDADWKKAAVEKGATRIVSGMKASEGKFVKGMQQNLATIQSVTIPARTQDPMSNIDNRLKPIAAALHKQRMG